MTKEQHRILEIALSQSLPYGLKLWDRDSEEGSEVIQLTGCSDVNGYFTIADEHGNFDIPLVDIKPLLRPLSYLVKPITHCDVSFVPIIELARLFHVNEKYRVTHYDNIQMYPNGVVSVNCCVENDSSRYKYYQVDTSNIESIPFGVIEKLNSWMFDYRGLINSGMAISVHDLPENPYAL